MQVKRNHYFNSIILFGVVLLSSCAYYEKDYPPISDYEFLSIKELKQQGEAVEVLALNTRGFVISIYGCPECPKYAVCKPCGRDHIIISEEYIKLTPYNFVANLNNLTLKIFVHNPKQFNVGEEYLFSIHVTDDGLPPAGYFELVGYNNAK